MSYWIKNKIRWHFIKGWASSVNCQYSVVPLWLVTLRWRHNERDGVSNHRRLDCLLNRLFRRTSKKTSKLRDTGLCDGNSPVTSEFPTQRASNKENDSSWWRHHEFSLKYIRHRIARPLGRDMCDVSAFKKWTVMPTVAIVALWAIPCYDLPSAFSTRSNIR